jgi:alkaline phosphatase
MLRTCCLLFLASITNALAGSVIFVHPDGAGISHWQAARFYWAGPDAELNWDRLPEIAVYRGHMADSLSATSNGGGTTHAYGIKVGSAAFGTDGKNPGRPVSASGRPASLMHEALEAGLRTGLVNSGSVVEPGTACFVASVASREDSAAIVDQLVESGVDVILGGGEESFLPKGKSGRHVAAGLREDGLDLVEKARSLGYHVVYDRKELLETPEGTQKLLGIFAARHTFNDVPEAKMKAENIPTYVEGAPTLAEMTSVALRILGDKTFFLVVEEEGSDNFANVNNAQGTLEALKRADDAFGVALDFVEKNKDTLLVTTADSSAGAMDVYGFPPTSAKAMQVLGGRDPNGAPYSLASDGSPFLSQPDRAGRRHPFVIVWGTMNDASGGILVRAAGRNSEKVRGNYDNTRIYQLMRETLFPRDIAAKPDK